MYTSEVLSDMHERGHRSLAKLLVHCAQFSAEEIDHHIPGFDEYTLRLRLHHIIGCEQYWIGVLRGVVHDEEADGYPDIAALQAYRERIFSDTEDYLRGASEQELNTPRPMTTWGDAQHELVPARVVLRTVTHIYHHLGQVLVMCRVMGKPGDRMDFPLIDS
jgi:uncharacterized damage-inducible protein DinB